MGSGRLWVGGWGGGCGGGVGEGASGRSFSKLTFSLGSIKILSIFGRIVRIWEDPSVELIKLFLFSFYSSISALHQFNDIIIQNK